MNEPTLDTCKASTMTRLLLIWAGVLLGAPLAFLVAGVLLEVIAHFMPSAHSWIAGAQLGILVGISCEAFTLLKREIGVTRGLPVVYGLIALLAMGINRSIGYQVGFEHPLLAIFVLSDVPALIGVIITVAYRGMERMPGGDKSQRPSP